jgi:zinc D-Ala-D-Ala carboxypeptidase
MLNRQVSENFYLREFACPCCGWYKPLTVQLVLSLQELRELIDKPIHINSGARCESHNRAVGGSSRSQHLLGTAVDVVVGGMSPEKLADYAYEVHGFLYGGVGVYKDKGFVHLDCRGKIARWSE